MAKLEWRVKQNINIADFMDTAFVIEFDGPGTFIAYLRDHQITCKEHIREYRDAVIWCQTQADRIEAEAKVQEVKANPLRDQIDNAVFDIISERFNTVRTVEDVDLLNIREKVVELILEQRIAVMRECMEVIQDVQERFEFDHENEMSSGSWSCLRAVNRKLRIEQGEDPEAVDKSMKI